MKRFIVGLVLSVTVALAMIPALAGNLTLLGAGKAGASAPAYQGPGDVVSGATLFGSCARAYNAAYANGTNSLCDLVDSAAPTSVICTLRVLTTGVVDLAAAYCTGSVTPATKCAAATGGTCNISKVYNQVNPGTNDWTQATAANQPKLTFSAVNGLPGMTFVAASATQINTPAAVTQTQPYSFSGVYKRTAGTTNSAILGVQSAGIDFGPSSTTAVTYLQAPVLLSSGATATENNFHALQAVANGASSAIVVNGTATSGSAGTANLSSNVIRFGRSSSGTTMDGIVMEGIFYPVALNATQYGDLNTNQHGANGYNF